MTPQRKGKGWRYVGVAGTRGAARKTSSDRLLVTRDAENRAGRRGKEERQTFDQRGDLSFGARLSRPGDGRRRATGRRKKRHSLPELLVWLAALVVAGALLFLLGREVPVLGAAGMVVFLVFAWLEFKRR